ncbi:MAG: hypothetical protein ABIQ30_06625 [Devosia sp.]
MTHDRNKPGTKPGTQMDDNVDDMGRKPDGSTLDQPGSGRVEKERDDPSKKDVEPGSDADSEDESLGV